MCDQSRRRPKKTVLRLLFFAHIFITCSTIYYITMHKTSINAIDNNSKGSLEFNPLRSNQETFNIGLIHETVNNNTKEFKEENYNEQYIKATVRIKVAEIYQPPESIIHVDFPLQFEHEDSENRNELQAVVQPVFEESDNSNTRQGVVRTRELHLKAISRDGHDVELDETAPEGFGEGVLVDENDDIIKESSTVKLAAKVALNVNEDEKYRLPNNMNANDNRRHAKAIESFRKTAMRQKMRNQNKRQLKSNNDTEGQKILTDYAKIQSTLNDDQSNLQIPDEDIIMQPTLDGDTIKQPILKADKMEKPLLNADKIEKPLLNADEIEQPLLNADKIEQPLLKAHKIEQPLLNADGINVDTVKQPILDDDTKIVKARRKIKKIQSSWDQAQKLVDSLTKKKHIETVGFNNGKEIPGIIPIDDQNGINDNSDPEIDKENDAKDVSEFRRGKVFENIQLMSENEFVFMYGTVPVRTYGTVPDSCSGIFIGIHSGPEMRDRRRGIRESYVKNISGGDVYRFILGYPTEEAILESNHYRDIIFINQTERYRQMDSILPYKTAAIFHIVSNMKFKPQWILKVDDDSFINLPILKIKIPYLNPWSMYGKCVIGYPNTNSNHKWYVNETYWNPNKTYPNYCLGSGYIMPIEGVKCAASYIEKPDHKYFPLEDVATGILMEKCHIKKVNLPGVNNYASDGHYVIVDHYITSRKQMLAQWRKRFKMPGN